MPIKPRISQAWERLRQQNGRALIPYITAGDPTLETTRQFIFALEEAGADMIELGVPFSDPMADGPTIQRASERALAGNVSLSDVLNLVREVRKKTEIPIILFGYYNPFFIYGTKRLASDARRAGVDGILAVDLPPEEAGELKTFTDQAGIDLIFLLAPTSTEERMRLIASHASGFIYYVSVTGVTGARSTLDKDIERYVKQIRTFSSLPVGVGFGISTPDQAKRIIRFADAVIVGSALIKVIEANIKSPHLVQRAAHFIRELKQAMV
ncbi:MAG TPA: tryptophan synthase subunit alpha [Thermodesulfobacteriota bacterium]|nr:tryptophan synthase subunit alpha [Thermodesulfobacteriota bacterium]